MACSAADRSAGASRRTVFSMRQLVRFAWLETQCCLFAGLFFAGLGVVQVVPLPLDAADALLVW